MKMLRFTKQVDYGLMAMQYVAEHQGDAQIGVKRRLPPNGGEGRRLYLNETMLDDVQQGLTGGFTFVNPNAKSSCGCGSSFSA
jgi:hypothetical protein